MTTHDNPRQWSTAKFLTVLALWALVNAGAVGYLARSNQINNAKRSKP